MTRLADLPTPVALVDLNALERNIVRMAERARAAGVALRPHAKTHKCAAIARRQIEAGAVGICCAKIGEAEALAGAGIGSILVTSPTSTPALAHRAVALARAGVDLAVTVDHPEAVAALAQAAGADASLRVLIDVDIGLHRTGVADAEAALTLAAAIAAAPGLRFGGVQGYGGNLQHIAGLDARRAATAEAVGRLRVVVDALRAAGHVVETITGGGTGTAQIDMEQGLFTELQPGSYVFMDKQYREALDGDEDGRFETSLVIRSTVISANHPKFVTLDAGLKAFSTDAGAPVALGVYAGLSYFFFGDEHGGLMRPAGGGLALGDQIDFMVPHCDPTVDRYDRLHFHRAGAVVEAVPIEARGRSA